MVLSGDKPKDNYEINYIVKKCTELSESELLKCSDLFSNNYGVWAADAPNGKAGNRIKMSVSYYKQNLCLQNDHYVAMAYNREELIGHAFYLRKIVGNKGYITWILQLVVHADYRKKGIGRRLMFAIWSFSNDLAWGLASANPLTVKALEEATMRQVNAQAIRNHIHLIDEIKKEVSFAGELQLDDDKSFINTGFYIDHSEIPIKLERYGREWKLGKELPSGVEWLAFTFSDQSLVIENRGILDNLISFSESQLKEAYGRMQFDTQKWAKYTEHEVNEIINILRLNGTETIADFGCAQGRHSIEMANRGFNVYGIDFVKSNIDRARKKARKLRLKNVKFICGDCRIQKLTNKANVALCLYDVVGSFPNEVDNITILKNVYQNLDVGGCLVLSVMNMELTYSIAKHIGDIYDNPQMLIKLKPNKIMQVSGNVFNPDHFMIDSKTGTVFRKEQFENDGKLPVECIIRDRRYSLKGICKILNHVGFSIINAKYVSLGNWNIGIDSKDERAKEILIFAKKEKSTIKRFFYKHMPLPKGWI